MVPWRWLLITSVQPIEPNNQAVGTHVASVFFSNEFLFIDDDFNCFKTRSCYKRQQYGAIKINSWGSPRWRFDVWKIVILSQTLQAVRTIDCMLKMDIATVKSPTVCGIHLQGACLAFWPTPYDHSQINTSLLLNLSWFAWKFYVASFAHIEWIQKSFI